MFSAAALTLSLLAAPALAQLPKLDRDAWTITASTTKGTSVAANAIDGDNLTIWRSTFGRPRDLVVDMQDTMTVDGVEMRSAPWLARRGANPKQYQIAVADGAEVPGSEGGWTTVASGDFADDAAPQKTSFAEAPARFVRLRIWSVHGSVAFTNVAELDFYGAAAGASSCGAPLEPACVDANGDLFCEDPAPGDDAVAPSPESGTCVTCGCCGLMPCVAPETPCEAGHERATRVESNGEGGVYCEACGSDCDDDFDHIPAVFASTPTTCSPPPRLGTPPASNILNVPDAAATYARENTNFEYTGDTVSLNFNSISNGGSFCLFDTPAYTSSPIVVGGTVFWSESGDVCVPAPTKTDGSSCCNIKLWQPSTSALYLDACSATVPIGSGGVYWFYTEVPGNEFISGWGPDDEPHIHWEINCQGCQPSDGPPGRQYSGRWTANNGYNKFYPNDVCVNAVDGGVCNGAVAGPEHQAQRLGKSVYKYDFYL